jgi:hypothetical protein
MLVVIGYTVTVKSDHSYEDDQVRTWITAHRGILTKIAVNCFCCPQFVQQVAYGTSTTRPGHEVELKLREAGWPGHRKMPRTTIKKV